MLVNFSQSHFFRTLQISLVALLLLIVIGYGMFSHLVHCHFVKYSSFKEYPEQVYVSPRMPQELVPSIQLIIKEAKQRNREFWNSLRSKPTFIFCVDDDEFGKFGKNYGTPAMVHLTLQGVFIIVKPDGVNVDVISHELCHAELFERVGWYAKIHKIPAWFDEGLALHLDYRYPGNGGNHYEDYQKKWLIYTRQGKDSLVLKDLEQIDNFFRADQHHTNLAYLTSGREVARWFDKVGAAGLKTLIKEVGSGADFKKTYQNLDKKTARQKP